MPPPPEIKLFSPIQTQKDYRTFLVMDRHKLMAQACARYPELQLGDDIREWMKEIDSLDDYSEKLIEDIKSQQKIERDSITAANFRQLRETQIKIRGLIRRLKITVEQKAEVNDKIEKFLDDFTTNLPMIFAETPATIKREEQEDEQQSSSTSVAPSRVVTPKIIKNEIEILKRAQEFAAEEWKIEQSFVQANATKSIPLTEYEAEEYDLPPPPSSGRGRRPQLPTASPKKSLNRSLASPRRAKKSNTTPTTAEEVQEEEEVEEELLPPPEKKSKTSLPAIIVSSKRRKSNGTRKSTEPKTRKTPSTPEEIAAKKEERAKVKKAKAEEQQKQQTEAEEIARLTAQLELEGDIPKRRAAATAAAVAIHSAHIPKTPVITAKSISKEKETSVPATSTPATTTTTPTPAAASAVAAGVGAITNRKRSMSKKVTRKSSQHRQSQKDETEEEEEETYCICNEISYGEMICCDNDGCKIQWFHFGCVGLKIKPKRGLNWYCNDCKNQVSSEKQSITKKK